jgi:hypothetical protein
VFINHHRFPNNDLNIPPKSFIDGEDPIRAILGMIKLRLGAGGAGGFVILPITKGNRALPIHKFEFPPKRERENNINKKLKPSYNKTVFCGAIFVTH